MPTRRKQRRIARKKSIGICLNLKDRGANVPADRIPAAGIGGLYRGRQGLTNQAGNESDGRSFLRREELKLPDRGAVVGGQDLKLSLIHISEPTRPY